MLHLFPISNGKTDTITTYQLSSRKMCKDFTTVFIMAIS